MRYKGRRTRRQIEAAFLFCAELLIPGTELGSRLDAIYAWCDRHVGRDNYAMTQRNERAALREWLQVRFRDEEAAAAFRAWADDLT